MFGYLLESPNRGNSNKYTKHMFIEMLNTMFVHNFWLIVTYLNEGFVPAKLTLLRISALYRVSV